jgi:hypothetical protein
MTEDVVLSFYDIPLLFTARDSDGAAYIVVFAREDADANREEWLLSPMSEQRRADVLAGVVDLHDAFALAEGGEVYRLIRQAGGCSGEWVQAATLGDDELPLAGQRADGRGEA